MIHNSSKITVMKWRWNNVMVGVTTTWGTVLMGCSIRKAETHGSKNFPSTLLYHFFLLKIVPHRSRQEQLHFATTSEASSLPEPDIPLSSDCVPLWQAKCFCSHLELTDLPLEFGILSRLATSRMLLLLLYPSLMCHGVSPVLNYPYPCTLSCLRRPHILLQLLLSIFLCLYVQQTLLNC